MKPSTREWVDKAEADLATAGRELRARRRPNFDAACFHAQQCAEKYLKARLVEADISFPKTHDLEALLDLILPQEPLWEALRPKLSDLTSFAITFRYPGDPPPVKWLRPPCPLARLSAAKSNKTSGFQSKAPRSPRRSLRRSLGEDGSQNGEEG